MSIRPRTLVTFLVTAFLLAGVAGCSDGAASVKNAGSDPSAEDTEDTGGTEPSDEPPCEATAAVDGTTYHVVKVVSDDYGVAPMVQLDGTATDCAGDGPRPITFHKIPHVDPAWALCGLVDGRWRVFLADDIAVPANSTLARIVAGR